MNNDLNTVVETLEATVNGPGQAAADALQAAFEQAGLGIEDALTRAAKNGETEFRRMAEAIIADLARIAAENVLTQSQLIPPNSQTAVPGQSQILVHLIATASLRGQRFL